ncbi:unnamed protein product [Cuscuta campestris]|uniref:Uncharacterized protein n=1 Tax=Cuscuta campestris TaxID=132261 RepID=A0A484MNX4_9ASTE|nr:unnamed protein product [Cuscuta campestris]
MESSSPGLPISELFVGASLINWAEIEGIQPRGYCSLEILQVLIDLFFGFFWLNFLMDYGRLAMLFLNLVLDFQSNQDFLEVNPIMGICELFIITHTHRFVHSPWVPYFEFFLETFVLKKQDEYEEYPLPKHDSWKGSLPLIQMTWLRLKDLQACLLYANVYHK